MDEQQPGFGRIGVFGSAFNPPQLAHLSFAEQARRQLGLDRLIVVPTGEPYHKENEADPGRTARLRLARAAFAGQKDVEVSDLEIRRPGPSYTCDTLEEIADRNRKSEIHLLMGADAALGFKDWHRPQRILELARIAIALRAGGTRVEVESAFEALGAGDRIDFVDMPRLDVSSSEVRRRIQQNEPFGDLVPTAVAKMIEDEDMYATQ